MDAAALGTRLAQFSKHSVHSLEYMLSDLDLRPLLDPLAHALSGRLEGMVPSGHASWHSTAAPPAPGRALKRKAPEDSSPRASRFDVVSRARLGDAERESLRVCLRCRRESQFAVATPGHTSDSMHPQNWLFIKWNFACPLCGGLWVNATRLGSNE